MHPPCQHAMWSRQILYISSGHVCETPFKTQYLRNSSWTSPELWPGLFTIFWRMISELPGLHRSRWWKILPGFTEVLGEISHMIHVSNTLGSTTKRLIWTFVESTFFFSRDSWMYPYQGTCSMGNPFIVNIYGLLVPPTKIPQEKSTFPSPNTHPPGHLAQNVSNHPTSWASQTLNTWESKSKSVVWKLKRTVKTQGVWEGFFFASPNPKGFFLGGEHFGCFFWQLLFNTWDPERKHLLSSYGDVLLNLFLKGDSPRSLKNVEKSFWTTKCYEHLLRPYQSTKD